MPRLRRKCEKRDRANSNLCMNPSRSFGLKWLVRPATPAHENLRTGYNWRAESYRNLCVWLVDQRDQSCHVLLLSSGRGTFNCYPLVSVDAYGSAIRDASEQLQLASKCDEEGSERQRSDKSGFASCSATVAHSKFPNDQRMASSSSSASCSLWAVQTPIRPPCPMARTMVHSSCRSTRCLPAGDWGNLGTRHL